MANKQIDELTEITSIEETDLLVVYDVDEGGTEKTKKILKSNFLPYETGSWTWTVADDPSAGNTSNTGSAYYTKMGNVVTVMGLVSTIDTTGLTAGNELFIQGLPFTVRVVVSVGSVLPTYITFTGNPTLIAPKDSNCLYIFNAVSAAGGNTVKVSDYTDDASSFRFQLTYLTD